MESNICCSKCNKNINSSSFPHGGIWLQTAGFFPDEVPVINFEEPRPYYLLCPTCKEELLKNLTAYKTVVKKEVVPF